MTSKITDPKTVNVKSDISYDRTEEQVPKQQLMTFYLEFSPANAIPICSSPVYDAVSATNPLVVNSAPFYDGINGKWRTSYLNLRTNDDSVIKEDFATSYYVRNGVSE